MFLFQLAGFDITINWYIFPFFLKETFWLHWAGLSRLLLGASIQAVISDKEKKSIKFTKTENFFPPLVWAT